jgi:hypothetical protein
LGFSFEVFANQLYLGLTNADTDFIHTIQRAIETDCFDIIVKAQGLPVSFNLCDGVTTNSEISNVSIGCHALVLTPDLTRLQVESIIIAAILATYDKENPVPASIEFSITGVFTKGEVVVIW